MYPTWVKFSVEVDTSVSDPLKAVTNPPLPVRWGAGPNRGLAGWPPIKAPLGPNILAPEALGR